MAVTTRKNARNTTFRMAPRDGSHLPRLRLMTAEPTVIQMKPSLNR